MHRSPCCNQLSIKALYVTPSHELVGKLAKRKKAKLKNNEGGHEFTGWSIEQLILFRMCSEAAFKNSWLLPTDLNL